MRSYEIYLKHNIYGFISESFALNFCIFVVLTDEKLLLPL